MQKFVRILYIIAVHVISFTFSRNEYYTKRGYPYEIKQYPMEQRMSPIQLRTAGAKPMHLQKLTITVPSTSQLLLNNTGDGVVGYVTGGDPVTLIGGPGLKNIYVLYLVVYQSDGVSNYTRAGPTEDGVGTAVLQVLVFYKKSLGSPANALNDPSGFIVILIPIHIVGNVANSRFEPYKNALYNLRQPYSTKTIKTKLAISWLLQVLPKCEYYFSFPGTIFSDPSNGGAVGKQYPGANIIQIPLDFCPFISYPQFYVYPSILNKNGQSTTNVLGSYEENGRPILQVTSGIEVHYTRR